MNNSGPIPKLLIVLILFTIVLNACAPATPTATATAPQPTNTFIQAPTDEPTEVPYQPEPETDEGATEMMYILMLGTVNEVTHTLEVIRETKDTRYIPVFIDLMRMNMIGMTTSSNFSKNVETLQAISGESFGDDWGAWVEWYGTTDYSPPPGFRKWKGGLLSAIDPRFANFFDDEQPTRIRPEEVVWGGVRVDGIPSLDFPTMLPPGEAFFLTPDEPVFGISINGDHRAYPLRIMDWHEMANDEVGGVPVSLAYCTLCGAGIAYDGRASDGNTYTFGSSGLLYRSNKLMYDHQTNTLWNQLTGDPVMGPLAESGIRLELLPVVLTTWEEWLAQHPETVVLDAQTGYDRPYYLGAAYGEYFSDEDTMFPVWQRSSLLPNKARIYALHIDGIPKAYPLEILAEEQVVNDTLGETPLVLVAQRGTVDVEGTSYQNNKSVEYNAGGEVRAYNRGEETFSPGDEVDTVLDSAGNTWQVTEEALIGPNGETAERVSGHLAYWFGWYAFLPNTLLYGTD